MFTHTSTWKKKHNKLPNLPTKDRQTCVQPGSAGRTEVTTALERLKLSTQNKTDRNKGFEKFEVSNVKKVVVFFSVKYKVRYLEEKNKHMGLEDVGQAIKLMSIVMWAESIFGYFKVGGWKLVSDFWVLEVQCHPFHGKFLGLNLDLQIMNLSRCKNLKNRQSFR